MTDPDRIGSSPKWPLWVGIFVALGSVATIGWAFIESWFG